MNGLVIFHQREQVTVVPREDVRKVCRFGSMVEITLASGLCVIVEAVDEKDIADGMVKDLTDVSMYWSKNIGLEGELIAVPMLITWRQLGDYSWSRTIGELP